MASSSPFSIPKPQVKTLISAASGAAADLKLKDGDQVHFGDYVPWRWGWEKIGMNGAAGDFKRGSPRNDEATIDL